MRRCADNTVIGGAVPPWWIISAMPTAGGAIAFICGSSSRRLDRSAPNTNAPVPQALSSIRKGDRSITRIAS
ncbi:hypothetical protein [Nostoc sp. CENA543]|uniref:hypothetical protein n=1 Tax=Nostoc sp. CENA543 TaxID=1869241 RepID=UPI0012FFFA1D|nr:hypothetical protein [Nostoc sp. CENA543]